MDTVMVAVRRAGRIVETIERPLREFRGVPAVAYRRQLWHLDDGLIDVDGPSLDGGETPPAARLHVAPSRQAPEMPDEDDNAVRLNIIEAAASARMLVEAGPGTGKTETAARRIAHLVRAELRPGQILVLSFSRSAVRTLTRRLGKIGETDARVIEELRHLSVRTFDSWAFRMLRLLGETPRTLLTRRHDANILALTTMVTGSRREEVRTLMGDRRHLIVDEFQDLPGVRGDLVLALLALMAPPGQPGHGFTILGDPAQAIFGFARGTREDGATYPSPAEYWRTVCQTYGGELSEMRLVRNHRAEPGLARLSRDLRYALLSDLPEDEKLRVTLEAVAALPATSVPLGRGLLEAPTGGSRAILTQTNGEALRVLRALYGSDPDAAEVPVRLHAGSHATLPPAWIGALLRKLRSTSLPRTQFGRIYEHLSAAWGEETCRRLALPQECVAWARLAQAAGGSEDDTSVDIIELRGRLSWPDAFPDDQALAEDGIIVTTIHQSKGMEFDFVTLLEPRPDDEAEGGVEVPERNGPSEQASVTYVGITRAAHTLDRAPADAIRRAPSHRSFADERRRLCSWFAGWANMEMGLRGDIDPLGFVCPELLGGAAGVEAVQSFLIAEAATLPGRKVMLCKHYEDGKATWHIHLQEGSKPGRLIGRTANQLSIDLLKVLHKHGYSLPSTIMNLRIAAVGTLTSESLASLGEPDRTSGLWLGVGLFGTGDFKPRKDKK